MMFVTPYIENVSPMTLYRPLQRPLHRPYSRFVVLRPSQENEEEEKKTSDSAKEPEQVTQPQSKVLLRRGPLEISRDNVQITFTVDVPGVKSQDVQVEIVDGEFLSISAVRTVGKSSTWTQRIELDKDRVDTSQAQATLVDGILSITIPTKEYTEPSPVEVSVTKGELDADSTATKVMAASLDVPGVKAEDINIEYHRGRLSVVAVRKKADSVVSKQLRSFLVDEKKVNALSLQAFLHDGVLEFIGQTPEPIPTQTVVVSEAFEQEATTAEDDVDAETAE